MDNQIREVKNGENKERVISVGGVVLNIDEKGMIFKRPVCGCCGKPDSGVVGYGGMFVCGNCAYKIHINEMKKQRKYAMEMVQDDN